MTLYFLYARKSTDVEDKQVRSIEDQLAVLEALAKEEGLTVKEVFIEKQSAKQPGRPIFNAMLSRIENGEADGVICWKLDRLARNPIDAARVQWLLQQGVIKHIRTNDRNYYPTDNVLMMGFEFGVANQYIRDLSANTKRGLHAKANRGEFPALAPLGYINDPRTKQIVVDKHEAAIVREAFELYSENGSRLDDIAHFLFDKGVRSQTSRRWENGGGRPWTRNKMTGFLSNIFYIGLFRYAGEIHEGKHKPIVSKELFDKVQTVLKKRGKPQKEGIEPKPLCGLFRCGECGRMITAEVQKGHTYYRCTKKYRTCSQPYIRQESLSAQLFAILKSYAMPPNWAAGLNRLADADEADAVQSASATSQAVREEIGVIFGKLQRLNRLYIDEDIERDTYLSEKAGLLSRKKSLEEKQTALAAGRLSWLEPLREWIKTAKTLDNLDETTPLPVQKSLALKITGSNPSLKNRRVELNPIFPYSALLAARKNIFLDKEKPSGLRESSSTVPRARVELATPASSGLRSTAELPRLTIRTS